MLQRSYNAPQRKLNFKEKVWEIETYINAGAGVIQQAAPVICPLHSCTAEMLQCNAGLAVNANGCELCECASGKFNKPQASSTTSFIEFNHLTSACNIRVSKFFSCKMIYCFDKRISGVQCHWQFLWKSQMCNE